MFYPYEGYRSVTPLDAARVNIWKKNAAFKTALTHYCCSNSAPLRCASCRRTSTLPNSGRKSELRVQLTVYVDVNTVRYKYEYQVLFTFPCI